MCVNFFFWITCKHKFQGVKLWMLPVLIQEIVKTNTNQTK